MSCSIFLHCLLPFLSHFRVVGPVSPIVMNSCCDPGTLTWSTHSGRYGYVHRPFCSAVLSVPSALDLLCLSVGSFQLFFQPKFSFQGTSEFFFDETVCLNLEFIFSYSSMYCSYFWQRQSLIFKVRLNLQFISSYNFMYSSYFLKDCNCTAVIISQSYKIPSAWNLEKVRSVHHVVSPTKFSSNYVLKRVSKVIIS